jgi:hypothetical protein
LNQQIRGSQVAKEKTNNCLCCVEKKKKNNSLKPNGAAAVVLAKNQYNNNENSELQTLLGDVPCEDERRYQLATLRSIGDRTRDNARYD